MVGGRSERGSRRAARAASVVVPFPRDATGGRLHPARFVPSGRSLLVAFAVVLGVAAAYWAAYTSSVFAVQEIDVRGATPAASRDVRAATSALLGRSLVSIDADAVADTVRALPSVAAASVDRAFPNTLVIKVAPERAVAVARRGDVSWEVAGSGKVVREIETGSELQLPRLWLPRAVAVRPGGHLPASFTPATRALEAVRQAGFRRRVKSVRTAGDELTIVLRNGPEVRLGRATDVGLKIAVAAKVLRFVEYGTGYVDVSVPERPVAGDESQVSG